MNFLAHAYLSFNHPQILVGNMISDFVKGRSRLGLSGNISQGISLHRDIDAFTDSHPATKEAKEYFRPHYRLYSGAIIDVLYDYYLANDHSIFSESSLAQFAQDTYQLLEEHAAYLPPNFLHAFTYMKAGNWLYHYRTPEGIHSSLRGLARRASFISEGETAFRLFMQHQDSIKTSYESFFPDVKQYAKQRFTELVL
ncbi:MAG: acyl carrier protein phosphodiesterase [Flavisolibacter sp.]